jgi:hypothetical protein
MGRAMKSLDLWTGPKILLDLDVFAFFSFFQFMAMYIKQKCLAMKGVKLIWKLVD